MFPSDFETSYTLVADARFSTPHSTCIEVYCNAGSAGLYSSATYPLPEGTVLVKPVYTGPPVASACSGNLSGYVAMRKGAAGSAPASGDWYWQELDADLNVIDSGQIQSCIGCHAQNASDDWTAIDPGTRL